MKTINVILKGYTVNVLVGSLQFLRNPCYEPTIVVHDTYVLWLNHTNLLK